MLTLSNLESFKCTILNRDLSIEEVNDKDFKEDRETLKSFY